MRTLEEVAASKGLKAVSFVVRSTLQLQQCNGGHVHNMIRGDCHSNAEYVAIKIRRNYFELYSFEIKGWQHWRRGNEWEEPQHFAGDTQLETRHLGLDNLKEKHKKTFIKRLQLSSNERVNEDTTPTTWL